MSNWLRDIREGAGLPRLLIAERVGISRQYYDFIENELRRPSPEVAKKIASELGFDWTRFYEDDPKEA